MVTIRVKGMSCNHCAAMVDKVLNEIEGIRDVRVDLEAGVAIFDEEKPVDLEVIRKHIQDAGYEVAEVIKLNRDKIK